MRNVVTLLFLCLTGSLFANIDIRTTIRQVDVNGAAERAGFYQFVLESDEFANVSFFNPVYIRLELDKDAVWSETLVKSLSFRKNQGPIFIPVILQGDTNNTVIDVPEYAVSIVRWKKGESSIWLKVSASSSTWVVTNGVAGPPTPSTNVVFTIGRTLSEDINANQSLYNQGLANLVAPKRIKGSQVGIPLTVDLTNSTLEPAPLPPALSLLNLLPTAYGPVFGKANDEVDFERFTFPSSIVFSNDTAIALGTLSSQAKRGIYHLPDAAQGGADNIIFNNNDDRMAKMVLLPYDEQGNLLDELTVDVPARGLQAKSMTDLFGNTQVSHFQIEGPQSCKVGVGLDDTFDTGIHSVLGETGEGIQSWELYPVLMAKSGKGLSLVNLGEENAAVSVQALDQQGRVIATAKWTFDGAFEPLAKQVVDLQEWFVGDQVPARLKFTSTEKMGVAVLHQAFTGQTVIEPVSNTVQ